MNIRHVTSITMSAVFVSATMVGFLSFFKVQIEEYVHDLLSLFNPYFLTGKHSTIKVREIKNIQYLEKRNDFDFRL